MPKDAELPIACELSTSDYQARLAWIADLNRAALRGYRREGRRVELTYEPASAPRVREFVRREQQCCPFLEFTIRRQEDTLTLEVVAPTEAADGADALFEPYLEGGPAT